MATIKTPDHIYKTMMQKGIRFYRVYDAEKRQIDFNNDPDSTPEGAAAALKETLDQLEGLVKIVLSEKSTAEKGQGGAVKNSDLHFDIVLGKASAVGAISGTGGDISALIAAGIAKEREKWETEEKIKRLEAELKEAKEGNPYIEQIIGGLAQILPALTQAPAPVAGQPGQGVPPARALAGVEDDRQARLTQAIRTLARIDKNYLEHLELLANLAENNTSIYWVAVNKLKSF